MSKQGGRDDARERIKKAAPSHGSQARQMESARNKKETADLKTNKGKDAAKK